MFGGPLKIGFNEPAINSFLPSLIKDFRRRNPDIVIALNEMESSHQPEALTRDRIDIGFARLYEAVPDEIARMFVFAENYLIAMPVDSRLSRLETVSPRMLKDEPLIIFPRRLDPKLHERMMSELMSGGYKPRLVQEAATKQTTLALVEAGLGIAFVPESISHIKRKGIEFRKFSAGLPKIEIYAIWRKNNKFPLLEKFIKCVSRLQCIK